MAVIPLIYGLPKKFIHEIQNVQNTAARVIKI